jgi:hypothetical protein
MRLDGAKWGLPAGGPGNTTGEEEMAQQRQCSVVHTNVGQILLICYITMTNFVLIEIVCYYINLLV